MSRFIKNLPISVTENKIEKHQHTVLKTIRERTSTYRSDIDENEEIKWNGRQEVQQKPTSDVIYHNQTSVVNDLAALRQERRSKVQHNICNVNVYIFKSGNVIYHNLASVVNDLAALRQERRSEVQHNICNEMFILLNRVT